ncbi:hypothetical protein B0H34DRAFT_853081 [Crassisporium funariophilum]|nr:hypothetical protein B0H34DRAFT_853081 [Crassisporium funariophilum]
MDFDTSFATYIQIGALSVMVWDTLQNLGNDYCLLFQHEVKFPTMVYTLSRITTLAYVVGKVVMLSDPIENCTTYEEAIIGILIVSVSSTMFLSYLRVCAVWDWDRRIVGIFGASWISVVAGNLTCIVSVKGVVVRVEGAPYCVDQIVGKYLAASFLSAMINHGAVLVALTYKLCKSNLAYSREVTVRDGLRMAVLGQSLPAFSKALLQESQICYIIAMISGVACAVWFYCWPSEPNSPLRLTLATPAITLTNIMLCRVFRNTKLGLNRSYGLPRRRGIPNRERENLSEMAKAAGESVHAEEMDDGEARPRTPIQVSVSQVVEFKVDSAAVRKSSGSVDVVSFSMV